MTNVWGFRWWSNYTRFADSVAIVSPAGFTIAPGGGVTLTNHGPNTLDLFGTFVGQQPPDQGVVKLFHKKYENSSWGGWVVRDDAGDKYGPAASYDSSLNKIELYQVDETNSVLYRKVWNGSTGNWSSWQSTGGQCGGTPSVVASGGEVDVFCPAYRATGVSHYRYGTSSCAGWRPLYAGVVGTPTASKHIPGKLDVYWRASGKIFKKSWSCLSNQDKWVNEEVVSDTLPNFTINRDPVVATWEWQGATDGRDNLFVVASDPVAPQALWWSANENSGFYRIDDHIEWTPRYDGAGYGNLNFPPGVTSWRKGRIDVVMVDTQGQLSWGYLPK